MYFRSKPSFPKIGRRVERQAELLAEVAVQPLLEVRHRAVPGEDPAAREGLVAPRRELGDRLEGVVGREREDDLPLREAAVERLEEAAELDVETAEDVEVLLGLRAVGVGDRVLAGERQAEDVGLVAVAELEVRRRPDLESEVHHELVDERAVVDAVEVAVRGEGHVLVPAEAVHRDLERPHLEGGDGADRGRGSPGREEGVGHLPPGEAEAAGEVPAGPRPVEAGDDLRHDGAAGRRGRRRRGTSRSGPSPGPTSRRRARASSRP